jgi:predicted Zn-dependent protease
MPAPLFESGPVTPTTATHRTQQSTSKAKTLAAIALAAGLATGCATTIITPEVEEALGSQMSVEVEEQAGLYVDDELNAYVDAVGARLVAAMEPGPYTFRFDIVDQGEPNAFASPGGYIYVSRGLLAQMNSEAELAGVLAHEISHVTQRHHAKQIGRSMRAGLMTLPGKAVGVVSKDMGDKIAQAGEIYLASYSRDQESEADAVGMRLSAAAGYDPSQLAGALIGIERSVELLSGEKHEPTFFDSHPTTPSRVADVDKLAAELPWNNRAPIADRRALYGHLDGLWWGPQNPQQGVFQGQTFLSSDLGLRLTFPDEWKTINTPMFVGAMEPEGGAFIALAGTERVEDPTELTDKVAASMLEQTGLSPAEQRVFKLGDWPASLLRYDDSSEGKTVSLYYVFVSTPSDSYNFTAMGLEEYREDLRDTAMSLRRPTTREIESIEGLRVRTASTRNGESLTQFSTRVANEWPVDLTAAINGLETNQQLPADSSYKIMRTEAYAR